MLSQAVAMESCDSAPKRKEDRCCPGSMALEANDVGLGCSLLPGRNWRKIDGAIQVPGVSRSPSDTCKVNSPESRDIPLSSGCDV